VPDGPAAPTSAADVFATSVLHRVALTVTPGALPGLRLDRNEYVVAQLIYDGLALADVGLRLKGSVGSGRELPGKAGFTIKTNEHVRGQELTGLRKLHLNNSVQDRTHAHEPLAYETFARAGLPSPRAAHARVTLNGAYMGCYVVREAIDARFLRRAFPDATGDLFEGESGVDITDVNDLDLETNEATSARDGPRALREALVTATAQDVAARVDPLVDVERFLRYWAVEALVDHWDAYAFGSDRRTFPNNYYAYFEPPTGRLVLIPHGADQTFVTVSSDPDRAPKAESLLAARLFLDPATSPRLRDALREALASAWDEAALTARVAEIRTLTSASIIEGPREPVSRAQYDSALGVLDAFIARRRGEALSRIPPP